jgi:hypothetical protein
MVISGPIYLEIPDLGVTLKAVARREATVVVGSYDDAQARTVGSRTL